MPFLAGDALPGIRPVKNLSGKVLAWLSVCESPVLLFVYERSWGITERIYAKFTRNTCLVPSLDEFEGQRSRSMSPGTKSGIFRQPVCAVYVWCNI